MKKRLFVVLAAASLGAAVMTSSASASVPVGGCTLHAYVPTGDSSVISGEGEIDSCSPTYQNLSLNVCLQQLVTGGWQFINSTCHSDAQNGVAYLGLYSYGIRPTANRYYRTHTKGTADGTTADYQSSGAKFS
jgi:hypothetical protein